MQAPDDLVFRDRAVYLPAADALVLADLHVGRDATSNVQVPVGERADLTDRLAALLDHFEPDEVVFAGDLLHSFRTVPRGARETVRALRDLVADADADAVVTPGNHDTMLGELWTGPTAGEHRLGDTVVLHGHDVPTGGEAARYVVGHDHPAISIEGRKRPCYLLGRDHYRGATVLMLPAFSRLPAGATVNQMRTGDFMCPLVTDADALAPLVRDEAGDETLAFPRLGRFRSML